MTRAGLQGLGWQDLWYLARGCRPPVRSRSVLGITFPFRLHSSQDKKMTSFIPWIFYLGNGTVGVQKTNGILGLITTLAHLFGVSCLLAEWLREEWCNVRELLGCCQWCICCFPLVHRHHSQHLEKTSWHSAPLASVSVCSFLETGFLWTKCKLTSKIFNFSQGTLFWRANNAQSRILLPTSFPFLFSWWQSDYFSCYFLFSCFCYFPNFQLLWKFPSGFCPNARKWTFKCESLGR